MPWDNHINGDDIVNLFKLNFSNVFKSHLLKHFYNTYLNNSLPYLNTVNITLL